MEKPAYYIAEACASKLLVVTTILGPKETEDIFRFIFDDLEKQWTKGPTVTAIGCCEFNRNIFVHYEISMDNDRRRIVVDLSLQNGIEYTKKVLQDKGFLN